jgi:hypothetical protein
VSIWAFDKSEFAKRKAISDKAVVEQLFQIMKRDFAVIKDCKVCSSIIQIIEVHASIIIIILLLLSSSVRPDGGCNGWQAAIASLINLLAAYEVTLHVFSMFYTIPLRSWKTPRTRSCSLLNVSSALCPTY